MMFALLCVAAGCFTGCAVCAFGMCAFLKGQKSMLQIKNGGLPEILGAKARNGSDLSGQLRAMFGEVREHE